MLTVSGVRFHDQRDTALLLCHTFSMALLLFNVTLSVAFGLWVMGSLPNASDIVTAINDWWYLLRFSSSLTIAGVFMSGQAVIAKILLVSETRAKSSAGIALPHSCPCTVLLLAKLWYVERLIWLSVSLLLSSFERSFVSVLWCRLLGTNIPWSATVAADMTFAGVDIHHVGVQSDSYIAGKAFITASTYLPESNLLQWYPVSYRQEIFCWSSSYRVARVVFAG